MNAGVVEFCNVLFIIVVEDTEEEVLVLLLLLLLAPLALLVLEIEEEDDEEEDPEEEDNDTVFDCWDEFDCKPPVFDTTIVGGNVGGVGVFGTTSGGGGIQDGSEQALKLRKLINQPTADGRTTAILLPIVGSSNSNCVID